MSLSKFVRMNAFFLIFLFQVFPSVAGKMHDFVKSAEKFVSKPQQGGMKFYSGMNALLRHEEEFRAMLQKKAEAQETAFHHYLEKYCDYLTQKRSVLYTGFVTNFGVKFELSLRDLIEEEVLPEICEEESGIENFSPDLIHNETQLKEESASHIQVSEVKEVQNMHISLQDDYYHLYKEEIQDGKTLGEHFGKLGLDIKKEIFFTNSAFEHLIDLGVFLDLRGIQKMLISLRGRAKNFHEKFNESDQIWYWGEFIEMIDLYDRFVDQLRVFFGTLSAQAKMKKITFFPQH